MENYKPNSHKSKEEQKNAGEMPKLQKVVNGTVKLKKKSEIHKFTDIFVAEDWSSVKTFLVDEMILPTLKKLTVDLIADGADMIINGRDGRSRRSGSSIGRSASYVSYDSFSRRNDRFRDEPRPRSRGFQCDDVILQSRRDAEEVLRQLEGTIRRYGMVSVASVYDLVGQQCSFTANDYGWYDLHSARVERVREGWILRLPRPEPLD